MVAGGVLVVGLVLAGVFVWPGLGGDDSETNASSQDGPTFVVSPVERRTLVDEITVRGEIRRDELQRITSGIDGRVSSVLVEDGDTITPGDTIFALDGRAAVAVNGDFAFFRELDVGSDGPDVLQLERILADLGYQVGRVDQLFTEETRSGLREWQISKGYGGATPEPEENITISLQNSNGYDVGSRNTVSVELGPSVPETPEADSADGDDEDDAGEDGDDEETLGAVGDGPTFLLLPGQDDPTPTPEPTVEPTPEPTAEPTPEPTAGPTTAPARPIIEVRVNPGSVVEGDDATFTFTSNIAMPSDTVVDYATSGSAAGGDDYDDDDLIGSFIFPGGDTTFDLVIETLTDDDIESDETLTIEVGGGGFTSDTDAYAPGPLKEATLDITSPPGDVMTITVTVEETTIDEGGNATYEISTDKVRNEATTITYMLAGSARDGSDYTTPEFEVDLPANAESVNVSIATRDDSLVEYNESLELKLTTNDDEDLYVVGEPAWATIIIESDDIPELTLEGGGVVGEGGSLGFTIRADQFVTEDTSVNYSLGGSATPGRDYKELSGTVIMGAGQSSVFVEIQTIDDDVIFLPGDMVVADWPARIGTVSVDEGEFILLGAEVLTLTEPDFTITLLLNPTDRGNLEINLAVSVELQASDQEAVPGIIQSLDETATIDATGAERYEGVITTFQPLDAVDGASVNVDVTRSEKVDVITVPVASVLQDGQGNDVVRVVLADGTTSQVQVEIGLSEGAFVEVTSGLEGNELVLVET